MTDHPRHRPFEIVLEGPEEVIPATIVPFVAVFTLGASEVRVPGFWDGGRRYVARFLPEREGTWTWRTESDDASLHAVTGELAVAGDDGHGVVRVADRFHFAHADGTPHRPVGTTVYNWIHQDEPLYSQTVEAIADAGFTKLRFLVFPQAGDHVTRFPDLLPFARSSDGRWDVARPVVEFFRRLDAAVRILGERGIQADVLLFTAYDGGRFGLDGLTEEEDAAYLRYVVARLAAYPHVWWSLCNEFDILDRPRERWTRMGELLAEIDPHDHLRSIHNLVELYDHNQPWVTHASIQNGHATTDFGRASLYRDVYGKPVVLDEIKYEGDTVERWGSLSAGQLVHRFWVATVSGTYASHGESYVLERDDLHIVQGGPLRGASPARLGFLRELLDDLGVAGLDPIDKWDDPEHVAGVARGLYIRYFGLSAPAEWTFRLPQATLTGERLVAGDAFEIDVIDTWNMTIRPLGRRFVLDDVQRNEAFARASAPVALPAGEAVALRIRRVG